MGWQVRWEGVISINAFLCLLHHSELLNLNILKVNCCCLSQEYEIVVCILKKDTRGFFFFTDWVILCCLCPRTFY